MIRTSIVIAGVVYMSSCSSTQFGGVTGQKSGGSNLTGAGAAGGDEKESQDPDSSKPGGSAKTKEASGIIGPDGSTGTATSDSSDPNATDSTGTGTATDVPAGDPLPNADDLGANGGGGINSDCLSKKAKEYNIALVIDASGSQLQTDPNYIRAKASKAFAIEMARTGRIFPTLSIEIGVVGFSDDAIVGTNGPQDVGKTGTTKVEADITQVTGTVKGSTNFEAGLRVGEEALVKMGAKKGEPTQRNYLVFLTDGDPNRSDTLTRTQAENNPTALAAAINKKVLGIVNNYDTALITVASGSQIQQKGIDVVQGMALPKVGTISPEHVGKYIRADTDKALGELSKTLGGIVSDCKK